MFPPPCFCYFQDSNGCRHPLFNVQETLDRTSLLTTRMLDVSGFNSRYCNDDAKGGGGGRKAATENKKLIFSVVRR